MQGFCVDALFG
ncbi:flocculation protein FLO9 [Kluyveromyces marxianus]|uniref:Flocculation protein FLO9 n=1 Tax=Kluyveromyces marxianus TaxID=4911 RepID=A0ABX6EQV0_KLUMA|nr:flocculation protein FLO9 [Kluyveromyces marxianus]